MTQSNNTKQQNLMVEYEADGQKVKLTPSIVKEYIAGNNDITMPEFKFFTELCKARKLNPFLKEAYLIKYGSSPAQIVVSKDVILKRAVLNPKYNGKESGLIVINKETGEISERKGCFYDPETEKLAGGWCKVYRKDWAYPEYMSVALSEVAQKTKEGKMNQSWMYKTATMLEKVAKVRALREAFVEEFAGMYVEDEFQDQKESEDLPVNEADPMSETIDGRFRTEIIPPEKENDEEFDFSSL